MVKPLYFDIVTDMHKKPRQSVGTEHPPAITRRWQYASILGSFTLGCSELLTGNFSSLAVAADGLHNIGDTVTNAMQSQDLLHTSMGAERLQRRRKIAHWIIATSSAAISAKAGADLFGGISHDPNRFGVLAAGASLLYNSALLIRLRQGIAMQHKQQEPEIDCHKERDLLKHLKHVDIPSAVLALGGVAAQKYGLPHTEQLAAIASGMLGVIAFRPTEANLNHSH